MVQAINSKKQNAAEILSVIQDHASFVIPLHLSPDGDMIASALAMEYILKEMGKMIHIVGEDRLGIESRIRFITPIDHIASEIPSMMDGFTEPSILLCLDAGEIGRYTNHLVTMPDPRIQGIINIDHHEDNPEDFGDYRYLNKDLSANTQVLMELSGEWGITISPELATLFMYGIYSDTGSLDNDNATTRVFTDLASLSELGASWHQIVKQISWNIPFPTLYYLRELLDSIEVDENDRYICVTATEEILSHYKGQQVDDDFIKHEVLRVYEGVDFICLIKEKRPDYITFSLRRRNDAIDVSEIARRASVRGGGHPPAAGGVFENIPLPEAKKKLLQSANEYLSELN